jgi:hypothetical protein
MQNFTSISSGTSLASSLALILNNDLTALSQNSGTAFPTANLQVGMLCWRTDLSQLYLLTSATPTWTLLIDLTRTLAYLNNPNFTGNPTAPTQSAGDTTTALATDAFVRNAVAGMTNVALTSNNVTLTAAQAGAMILNFTGALTANIIVTLPALTGSWVVRNNTSGAYTLTIASAGAGSSLVVAQGKSNAIWSDAVNILPEQNDFALSQMVTQTAGDASNAPATDAFVRTAVSGLVSVSLAGGNVTLTAAQAGVMEVILTGALTANTTVTFPALSGSWIVRNATSGNYVVTLASAGAGSSLALAQGQSNAIWSDATNIFPEQSDFANATAQGFPTTQRRNCAQAGSFANGNGNTAAFINTGSGLQPKLLATSVALALTFAFGMGPLGQIDVGAQINADTSWPAVPASVQSFLYVQRNTTTGALTLGSTQAPPLQFPGSTCYGIPYATNEGYYQSLLNFETGAPIDDAGGMWFAAGGAKQQSTAVKFGTYALGGGGTNNVLNGTTDYLYSSPGQFPYLGVNGGGWTMRAQVYFTSLGAALSGVISNVNGAGYGAVVNVASTGKVSLNLSSTGTSWDIASALAGTTVLTTGAYNLIELTYDPVAGKYYVYINGTADSTAVVTSSAKVCGLGSNGSIRVGASNTAGTTYYTTGYVDAFELLPYTLHPAGTAYSVPVSAPSIAAAGYASDYYDYETGVMYTPSGPNISTLGGPTLSKIQRIYLGECIAGAAAISSVIAYAFNRRYTGQWTLGLPAVATLMTAADNLGTVFKQAKLEAMCLVSENGFVVGDIIEPITLPASTYVTPFVPRKQRNASIFVTGAVTAFYAIHASTGASVAMTAANWAWRIRVMGDY